MISPQLAKPIKNLLHPTMWGFVMEPKLDGYRILLHKKGEKVTAYNRDGRDKTAHLTHITNPLKDLPDDCIIDGEVVYITSFKRWRDKTLPLTDFARTASVMQSNPAKAIADQDANGSLTFVAFDCLAAKDLNLMPHPDNFRRNALSLIHAHLDIYRKAEHFAMIPRWSKWDESMYAELIGMGVEGMMLKDPSAIYRPGSRSDAWLKFKNTDTTDVVVMGFNDGEGGFKQQGLIGSIEFGQFKSGVLYKRGQCSGMSLTTRKDISLNPDAYIGKVMEVKYFGQSGKDRNGIRHPQFVGFRDDKRPQECVWESV